MALTFSELEQGLSAESGDRLSSGVPYVGTGGSASETESEALAALAAVVPSTRDGKTLGGIRVEATGGGTWSGTATYRDPSYSAVAGAKSYAFNITAGTKHVKHSIETTDSYAVTGTAADFKTAINVTVEGGKWTVGGVDAFVPESEWEETVWLADSVVTSAYKSLLRSLVGTLNDAPFKGDDTHECIFVGAQGSRAPGSLWQVTFRFRSSPNQTGLTVGDITGIDKDGWEYLWVYFGTEEDVAASSTVVRPKYAYTERIYYDTDFSLIGIGTT